MRKFFEKLIAAKKKKADELRAAIKAAETADEVRSLGDTLQAVLDELREAEEKLAELDDEGSTGGDEGGTEGRSHNPMQAFRQLTQVSTQQRSAEDEDPTNSVEYRTAFMNYVCRGTAIPMELRNEFTMTADAAAVIPSTILQEIVKEMKGYGEIWQRVRKLSVQGGVNIPIIDLKPTASWIGEAAASADQKISAKESVSFSYYGLECKIAQSLLVNVTTLDVFQREFALLAAEAMVQAIEVAIFTGDGNGKPMGILKDTRVTNKVTLSAEEFGSWSAWKKKVFAKMKKAYRKGSFVMAQGTFDGYIDGMVDQNGQPIGRVNYGIADGEVYRFGGKETITVETDIIADYDSATTGDVVAVFVNLPDYGVNTNMQMQVVKWTDHDNNQIKNKAIMICDGKLIDPNGVVLVVKG